VHGFANRHAQRANQLHRKRNGAVNSSTVTITLGNETVRRSLNEVQRVAATTTNLLPALIEAAKW
jgi:hypothetical protein